MDTIVHLTTVHPRDDARILVKEAQTLASNMRYKVVLMVADGAGHLDKKNGKVSIHDLGRLVGGRLRRAVKGTWRSFFAIRKIKPAIVHFHDPELIPLGLLLRGIGCQVIYDVHEDVPRQTLSKHYMPVIIREPISWVISAVELIGSKAFDAIIPATPSIAKRFPANKTIVIQNFPIITEMSYSTPIPYGERPQAFAYPGYIAKIRGIFEVVHALDMLNDINGIRLDLAGEFSEPDIEDEIRVFPGWTLVKYHGWISREELARLLGNVRAGLVLHHPVPNEIDAQPIKLYEYMSAGLPIIASNFPLLKQIIEDEGCGLLVDPMDPKAIAAAMRWILDHSREAEAMGQRGRQAVLREYNWDAEAVKLINLYNKMLGA
jgi:glycosyltransferase involved in cell wall biosynthesis